ncbi:hypothetical protein F7725_008359, partial [Dissostichus mawsoni]
MFVQTQIGIKSSPPARGEKDNSFSVSAPLLHLVVERLNVKTSKDVFVSLTLCFKKVNSASVGYCRLFCFLSSNVLLCLCTW